MSDGFSSGCGQGCGCIFGVIAAIVLVVIVAASCLAALGGSDNSPQLLSGTSKLATA